ncbi:hypothetical protein CLV59_106215 [Chitinophaga dinghuensis]|uniref:Peptidase M1 membrane alanine aminopeptidase domain-containing protein n=1 Tax=Chitinophaga dinghuensis TaxID=1539050 RepID=A0A327VWD9_9BACT|nr:M1 family metallopeptidase [Chitinophaga dinghuensis]RAJ79154.1 hypothetical protein CLV59_106215 [Chitinophaga dinghuensis]
MKSRLIFIVLLGTMFQQATAQQLYMPRNIRQAYVNGTRSTTGAPGPKYWQNRANYDIKVSFAPKSRLVSGSETVMYTNNSPDTLRNLTLKLFPNLYQHGSIRGMPIAASDMGDGVALANVKVNGISIGNLKTAGTNLQLDIPETLPGTQLKLELDFSYTLNETSHIRTGMVDPGAHFIAYFFPRIAVYDDINGWDRIPYIGTTEFYNDFCNFSVAITVPGDYQAWATGDLKNGPDVLQAKYLQRIAQAEKNNDIITIIDNTDLAAGNITKNSTSNTWHYEANNVTDFVFAVSNHYIWKSSSVEVDPKTKRRTRVDAVFNPQHEDFHEVPSFARKTVESMSYRFPRWPYPYSHETVFDGLDQMEYPMMVNDNPLSSKEQTIELTDHEIMHTMFPFYMGTNETLYAWMDEGWATIGEWLISPMIDSTIIDNYGMAPYNTIAGRSQDLPIMTASNQLTESYMVNSYPKPGLGYLYVKDLLGDSLFLKALHHYIATWNGKHPQPYDFFNCMNAGAGRNLNWFWKSWFFDDGYPDLAITSVNQQGKNGSVVVTSIGTKPIPVDLTLYFTDGSTQQLHRTIACWEHGEKTVRVDFTSPKKISKVVLGNTWSADVDPSNNVYTMPK